MQLSRFVERFRLVFRRAQEQTESADAHGTRLDARTNLGQEHDYACL
jgi:hypothetical protein